MVCSYSSLDDRTAQTHVRDKIHEYASSIYRRCSFLNIRWIYARVFSLHRSRLSRWNRGDHDWNESGANGGYAYVDLEQEEIYQARSYLPQNLALVKDIRKDRGPGKRNMTLDYKFFSNVSTVFYPCNMLMPYV